MKYTKEDLAINGGPKAKTTPSIPMFPGGLEIGEAEKKEVMEVLDSKYLCSATTALRRCPQR